MKSIDENELYKLLMTYLVLMIMIGIVLINVLGYMILSEVKKGNKNLIVGQNQIAGFMMVPGPQQTGPITILYDIVVDNNNSGIPHKEVNEKAQPKK